MPIKDQEKRLAYQRKWYQENSEITRKKVRMRKIKVSKWFKKIKASLRCEICACNHPACIEFHHHKNKVNTISSMVWQGFGQKAILNEISKCSVLCSNCHRIVHRKFSSTNHKHVKMKSKEKRIWYQNYKKNLWCKKCGMRDSRCIDLHHKNPQEKKDHLALMVPRYGRKTVLEEISKCIPLCANCHKIEHYGHLF